jgi:thiamine transporter ThiT
MFGKNTFEPGTIVYIILFSIRMMHLVVMSYRFSKGESLYIAHLFENKEEFEASKKTVKESHKELCANVLRFVLHFICYAAVFGLYWNNN